MEAPCSSGNVADQSSVTDWPQMMERLPSLSEIMSSFGLPESTQMASVICAQELSSNVENGAERNLRGKKRKKLPECGALRSHSPSVRNQNAEAEQQKNAATETSESPTEHKNGVGQTKEDYVHVRAKRGQATNSHSLAERVRREKISERMRLLQDLVPGCNKINGKALMLDEIINYVQSLQRQVEFLSMKLAAVNPELNLDIEQIFTKENLHLRFGTGSSPVLGYCPHPRHSSSMPQMLSPWNDEFQNAMRMGLIPNLPHDAVELNWFYEGGVVITPCASSQFARFY